MTSNAPRKIRTAVQEFNYRRGDNGEIVFDLRKPIVNTQSGKQISATYRYETVKTGVTR